MSDYIKFNGDRTYWDRFETEVDEDLKTHSFPGYLFLHPEEMTPSVEYTLDDKGVPTDAPQEYKTLKLPVLDQQGSQADRSLRIQEYNVIKSHNDTQSKIFECIRSAISSRLDSTLLVAYSKIPSNLAIYAYWKELQSTYGHDTLSHIAQGDSFLSTLAIKMQDSDSFVPTMSKMKVLWDKANFTEEMRLGMLLSDGTNPLKLQFLPQRFNKAIENARLQNYTFAKAVKYFAKQDQQTKRTISVQTTSVNRVSKKTEARSDISVKQTRKRKFPLTTKEASNTSDEEDGEVCCCGCGEEYIKKREHYTSCLKCFRKKLKKDKKQQLKQTIKRIINEQADSDDDDDISAREMNRIFGRLG
jgi:hypothetical protein